MSRLGAAALETTIAEHRSLGLPTTPEQVQALMALYNGTLLTLIVAPPETVTPQVASVLARCLVTGVLHAMPSAQDPSDLLTLSGHFIVLDSKRSCKNWYVAHGG